MSINRKFMVHPYVEILYFLNSKMRLDSGAKTIPL